MKRFVFFVIKLLTKRVTQAYSDPAYLVNDVYTIQVNIEATNYDEAVGKLVQKGYEVRDISGVYSEDLLDKKE